MCTVRSETIVDNWKPFCNTHITYSQEVKATRQFGQLIEYSMSYIFTEKFYTKHAGKIIPRLLFKKSKLSISLDQKCKF